MKFTHLVILKVSPYYIHSNSEEDALQTISKLPSDHIVGVAYSPAGIEVLTPTVQVVLKPQEVKYLQHSPDMPVDPVDEEVLAKALEEPTDVAQKD